MHKHYKDFSKKSTTFLYYEQYNIFYSTVHMNGGEILEREYFWTLLWAIEGKPFIRGLFFKDKDSDALKTKEIDFRVILSQDLTGSDQATPAENPSDERQNNKQTIASRTGPGSNR
jgi:hypothetical protein